MNKVLFENKIFSGNVLKIIALISMTFDHVGLTFFPSALWMRIVGRLAFPIFAFMIAEGCRYTKHKARYLGTLAIMALVMQIIYFVFEKSLYMCIFVTFTLSVSCIYAIDNFKKQKNFISFIFAFGVLVGVFYLTKILTQNTSFWVDYGFWGVMLPPVVYFCKNKTQKAIAFTIMLILVSLDLGGIQLYSLLSIPLIVLYNGKRGKLNLKYLFYMYYPLHLAVIYLIEVIA